MKPPSEKMLQNQVKLILQRFRACFNCASTMLQTMSLRLPAPENKFQKNVATENWSKKCGRGGFLALCAPGLKNRPIWGFTWPSPRDIQKALGFIQLVIFSPNHSELGQMNATTVLRVPNFTPHFFFKKILECSFLHEIHDFSHRDPG